MWVFWENFKKFVFFWFYIYKLEVFYFHVFLIIFTETDIFRIFEKKVVFFFTFFTFYWNFVIFLLLHIQTVGLKNYFSGPKNLGFPRVFWHFDEKLVFFVTFFSICNIFHFFHFCIPKIDFFVSKISKKIDLFSVNKYDYLTVLALRRKKSKKLEIF